MNLNHPLRGGLDEPARYEVRIEGHLDGEWAEWFEGLTVTVQTDGTTLLSGLLADQSALQGLIRKIGSLGMTLVSINVIKTGDEQ